MKEFEKKSIEMIETLFSGSERDMILSSLASREEEAFSTIVDYNFHDDLKWNGLKAIYRGIFLSGLVEESSRKLDNVRFWLSL